jgi:hypothetical protein
MGDSFERGGRVKLARKAAKPLITKQRKTNWIARRGTVIRVSPVSDNITIQWDDRATVDLWPTRAGKSLATVSSCLVVILDGD